MRTMNFRFQLAACAIAALVSACGGGDATAPGSGTSASSGFAIDGYLSGATVLCDSNGNGMADSGERTVITDSSGFFRFSPSCASALVATGGTSIDTGLAFTGTLKAPSGATVITPLTTLIANGGSQSAINSALGLPADTNLLTTDPARTQVGSITLVNTDLMKKTLVIQQFAQKITEVIAGLATSGGDAARAAIYSEVMAALAQALAANPALISGSTISETSAQALIKAAVQRVAASTLPAAVKAGVAALNPDSLAQVMAGALKIQGETILGASGDTLTAKTKAAQESTAITSFIQTNKANSALTGAPTPATANLASTLKDTVLGVTPPTPTAGTVLLSFDESPALFSAMGEYGGAVPTVEAGPSGGSGSALKVVKPAGAQWWSGIFFTLPRIPFTADRKVITARVYSTRANATLALKVEVPGGANFEEVSAPLAANTWTNVTWTFSGVNPSDQYTVIAITPDKNESVTPNGTAYYIDNIALAPAVVAAPSGTVLLSFDESPALFSAMGEYGGAVPTVEAGPSGGSGSALKVVKPAGAQWWSGIFFTLPRIPFTADRKVITARVYSTRANATLALKVEVPGGANFEEVSAPLAANTWTNVTWTFSGVNPSDQYTVIAITPDKNESVTPNGTAYYIDNIALAPATGGGGGGSGASTLPITFDSASVSYSFEPFEGASAGEVVADPAGGTNKVGKVVRAAGGPWYGGVTVSTGANRSIATIPFAAGAKSMTMRVFSPGAGMRVRMKVENASNAGITSETDAVTVGTGWEVLTFNFNNPGLSPPVTGGPTAELNVAQTYNKVTLFFNVAAANGAWGGTYYFDDIAFVAPANGGGGSSNAGTVTFSSGFAANSLTPQGGLYYAASGSSATDWNCPANSPGICGTGGNFNGAADSSIYTYFQFPTGSAPTGLYVGVSVLAPNVTELSNTGNTAGVTLAGQTKINFKFNQNPEWFNSTTKNFLVMLEMGKRYVVGNNATCRIQLHRVVTPTSADPTNYSINLSDFSVAQNCGTSLNTVAQALADGPVSQVTFQGAGGASSVTRNGLASGANFNVAAGTVIPTTVALAGAITFN